MSSAQSDGKAPQTLILMRHAKSDWSDGALPDHDRPLNDRGRRDTPRMANWLAELDLVPDLILCSSAQRTRETAQLLCDQWDSTPEILYSQQLYLASPMDIADTINRDVNRSSRLMVLAHNPGMSYLVSALAGESLDMPTAAMAVFQVEKPWYEFRSDQRCRLTDFMRPKALRKS